MPDSKDLTPHLLAPLEIGGKPVRNRIAMAPMTRHRALLDGTPTDAMVEYYRQRAGAGLIVTEGTYPSDMGKAYLFIPGLTQQCHVKGWRKVTDAVHAAGGTIFCQLMHSGRLTDPLMLPGGAQPVGPSAVQPDPTARLYTIHCPRPKRAAPYPEPRAFTVAEIKQAVSDFRDAAVRAREAGFDGVEIYAASGYLPHQFLSTNANQRTDEYGGSVEGRSRFLLECVESIAQAVGSKFVAVKVSPGWRFHDVDDTDPVATFTYLVKELSKRSIAFLEVGNYGQSWDVHATLRPLFDGPYMAVAGFTRASGAQMIADGGADMIAFGQAYLANPDLAERYANGQDINLVDFATFYTQGVEGYTDYPIFADSDHEHLANVDSPPRPLMREGKLTSLEDAA